MWGTSQALATPRSCLGYMHASQDCLGSASPCKWSEWALPYVLIRFPRAVFSLGVYWLEYCPQIGEHTLTQWSQNYVALHWMLARPRQDFLFFHILLFKDKLYCWWEKSPVLIIVYICILWWDIVKCKYGWSFVSLCWKLAFTCFLSLELMKPQWSFNSELQLESEYTFHCHTRLAMASDERTCNL